MEKTRKKAWWLGDNADTCVLMSEWRSSEAMTALALVKSEGKGRGDGHRKGGS